MKLPEKSRDTLVAVASGVALSSSLAVGTAFADDTEVFFGQVTSNSDTHPNVMFVLDTSGSMNYDSPTRLERMKDAMYTILDETANVNVGLMRFNGHEGGGAVLHPVRPIDSLVCTGAACGTLGVVSKVNRPEGDAEQAYSLPIVTTVTPTLSEAEATAAAATAAAGGATSGTTAVTTTTAPVSPNMEVELTDSSIEIGNPVADEKNVAAFHFEKLNIPQGATITSARLEFRSHEENHSIANFTIWAEDVDDATPFTETDGDITARTPAGVTQAWSPEGWLIDEDYVSEDISSVVQQIVDRTNWCGGNDMNIMIEGTGIRAVRSYDEWETTAPTLRLNYTTENIATGGGCMRFPALSSVSHGKDDAEELITRWNKVRVSSPDLEMPRDGGDEQLVGIRFPNLDVPNGAVIESAFIELTTDSDQTGNVNMTIHGQAIGNAPRFKAENRNISERTPTIEEASFNSPQPVGAGQPVLTPDISNVLQEIVNRSDWQRGNAAAFIISGQQGAAWRDYRAFDQYPNTPAKIKVIYKHTVGGASTSQVTMRDKLKSIVNEMVAHDGTPIVDAYYEAALYMTGGNVDYGKKRGTTANWWSERRYQRISHPESWDPTTAAVSRSTQCKDDNLNSRDCRTEQIIGDAAYISPMVSSCQTNHIVFLTDGEPTSNDSSNKVKSLIGATDCAAQGDNDELCGRELSKWLHDTDHDPSLSGKQNISTYTIGFNYQGDFLKDLASEGNGQYFKATDTGELVQVFKDILGDVLAVDTSFVAPGATVNQFNRLTHRNDIYFALFKPDQRPTWDGNLKRYKVDIDSTGQIAILDKKNNPAVDESSGFFHAESESWWSGFQDGNTVRKGGAAEELYWDQTGTIPNRRAFTYMQDYSNLASGHADLTAATARLHEQNSLITLDHLGIANIQASNTAKDNFRRDMLKWTRGLDVKDENDNGVYDDYRKHIGDPMHARPVILNYATTNSALSTVFVGTNEGFIHAIEREEGKELYAFMPKELLGNIRPYFDNQSSSNHPYGMDGALSVWTTDLNNNVMIDPGEKAFLYSGMRRGGNNYYALNVSNRMNPKLEWVIEGGPGGTPGFAELGQTWSRAVPNKIVINGVIRDVLIFSAGYDTNADPDPKGLVVEQSNDSIGRGFYIVDAETGELVYAVLSNNADTSGIPAGKLLQMPDMDYSVPSDIRALDTNSDGYTDQLWFGDMGGQIWRFDFTQYHKGPSSGPILQGGVFADLAGNSSQNHRRFYYEPDIAIISHEGARFLSISIGSGWRAHPLNNVVDDRFYVMRSSDVVSIPDGSGMLDPNTNNYRPIRESDLTNVTNDIDADAGPYGWMLNLVENGEKVLGDSVTVNNQVIFSSYKPDLTASACTTAIGGGSVYVLNILNGSPRVDLDNDGDIDEDDRQEELAHGGIPPEPAVLITEHGPTVLVGPEQPVKPDFDNLTQRTYWIKPGDNTARQLVSGPGN